MAPAPNGHLAIEAVIRHLRFHGSTVPLELDRVADGQVMEAEIPRASLPGPNDPDAMPVTRIGGRWAADLENSENFDEYSARFRRIR